ncbi:MAG: hypothetical protein H8D43_01155 [Chloroflexi bacterium]|nr:hypothetical protein [Chloroflexota bacterium]
MTTWTEEEITQLRDSLKQELDAAINQSEWKRLGTLSEALRLMDQRESNTDLDVLAKQVEALVGEDLILQALEAPPGPQDGEEVISPVAQEPEPAPAEEVSLPVPPTSENVTEALQEREALPEAELPSPLDPELQAALQPLLEQLRDLRDEEPQDLKDLPGYIGRLQRLTQDIMQVAPQSPEAIQATGEVALLHEMQRLADETRRGRRTMQTAQERLDLGQASKARKGADTLLRRAGDERYAGSFFALASRMRDEAEELANQAETVRQDVAAKLRLYLTRRYLDVREKLESQLDDLDELVRLGVPTIPTDLTSEVVEDTVQVYGDLRVRLLTLCMTEAQRLYSEAQEYLGEDLDTARERCETGLGFAQSGHIKDSKDAQDVTDKIQALLKEISKWEERREEARQWYDQATHAENAFVALNALARAESLFAWLHGLKEERERWLGLLQNQLQTSVQSAISKANALAQARQYPGALDVLNEVRVTFARLPPEVEPDLRELKQPLSEEEQKIKDEHMAWLVFEPRLNRLKQLSPRVVEGNLDEKWLQELEQQFDPEDLQRFGREWNDLKADLAVRAGDQARYNEALTRFQENPLDKSIITLLSGISDPSLHEDAQRLLRRQRAHAALDEAHQKLANRGLVEDPDIRAWLRTISRDARAARVNATEKEDTGIASEAQTVIDGIQRLSSLQEEISKLARRGEYVDAWKLVEPEMASEGWDPLVVNGLRWLSLDLRRRWRNERMTFVSDRVLADVEPDCQPQSGVQLEDLRRAAAYVEELEEGGALTEDGDGLIAECVHRLWHEAEVAEILGTDPTNASEDTVASLVEKRNVDWHRLLEHLEVLAHHTRGYSSASRSALERLRIVALGHYALNQPRSIAIERLQTEREQHSRLREDPLVCGILALRELEAPEGREAVQQLVEELRDLGRSAQRVADALEMLLHAYELHDSGDLELAIAYMEVAAGTLRELVSDFGSGIDEAVQDTALRWRRALGEELLNKALQREPTTEGLETFAVLCDARRAEELLGADPRVVALIERLLGKVGQALSDLHEKVDELLKDSPTRLEKAIQDARQLEGYLKEVVSPDYRSVGARRRSAADAQLEVLAQDLEDLQVQLDMWEKAQRGVQAARKELRRLLEAEWRWNTLPRQTPNRELRDIRDRLGEVRDAFGGDGPPEVEGMWQLVHSLEKAVQETSEPFEEFRIGFEGDRYRSDEKFKNAQDQLHKLQQLIETWQRRITEQAYAMTWGGPAINLNRFFLVHDHYGRPHLRDGHWVEGPPEDLRSPAQAADRLEERRRSWQRWQEWVEDTVKLLGTLQDNLIAAERNLRKGWLGHTITLCEETIPNILEALEANQSRMPGPPLCQLALLAARSTGDLQMDLDAETDLQRAWDQLGSTPRKEMPAAWHKYLDVEQSLARERLEVLQDTCNNLQAQLERLIQEINQHARVLGKKPTLASQRIYDNLLTEAETIDSEDPEVRGHRQRYDIARAKLEQK